MGKDEAGDLWGYFGRIGFGIRDCGIKDEDAGWRSRDADGRRDGEQLQGELHRRGNAGGG